MTKKKKKKKKKKKLTQKVILKMHLKHLKMF